MATEGRQMRAGDGTELYVRVSGDGPALLFLHAVALNGGIWEPVHAHLRGSWTSVCPDLRGHGRSALGEGRRAVDMNRYARDCVEILDGLGIERAIWVGLSIGGMVSLTAAVHFPERVRALVLANTHAATPEGAREGLLHRAAELEREGMASQIDTTLARWVDDHARAALPDLEPALRSLLERANAAGYAAASRAIASYSLRDRLAEVRCPTLVVVGGRDRSVPAELSKPLLSIPGARRVVLDSGHLSPLEQPQAFAEAVEAFAREVVERAR